ncbi:MAG: ATP-binding protein, partial [Candidatus Nanoarchaeia archaeon]
MVFTFSTTKEIEVPSSIVAQIIGQEHAVEIIKKAALQRRHVALIGLPGTGKSMLGQALAELLPKSKLVDLLVFPNQFDENQPIVKCVPAGEGHKLIEKAKYTSLSLARNQQLLFFSLAIVVLAIPWYLRSIYGDVMAAASLIGGMLFVAALALSFGLGMRKPSKILEPKVIVDNA